jgi:transposase
MSSSSAASIIYVGMDVHKDSITIAVLPMAAKNPTRLERLPNDLPKLKRFLDRLARDGELRVCYEASGAGYVLHRALREWGYACDVIAPSLIPKRPGVQRNRLNLHGETRVSEDRRCLGRRVLRWTSDCASCVMP